MRHSVLIYDTMIKAIRTMKDEDRLAIYDAIFKYSLFGEEIDEAAFSTESLRVWTLIMPIINATLRRYDKREARREVKKEEAAEKG